MKSENVQTVRCVYLQELKRQKIRLVSGKKNIKKEYPGENQRENISGWSVFTLKHLGWWISKPGPQTSHPSITWGTG